MTPKLTRTQMDVLKAAILADPVIGQLDYTGTAENDIVARDWLNTAAAPAFYAWKTRVTRSEIYHQTSPEGTTWNWATYKAQSVPEQNAWVQMFMGDEADFSLDNLRLGVESIFGASGANGVQRTHVLAAGKRATTRAEKTLAVGTGTLVAPAKVTAQGDVTELEVGSIMRG